MDIFQYLEKREIKLGEIFSRKQNTQEANELALGFRKLGHLFEKKVKTWWDIVSFEQYLAEKLIPRRLRWEVPPNDGLMDNDSLKEWGDFFTSKGLELVGFLLSRKRRKMTQLDIQIMELKSTMESHKESEEFLRLSAELKNKLQKWDYEIQNKKKKKFIRDLEDFGRGNVYKWQLKSGDGNNILSHPDLQATDYPNTPLPTPIEEPVFSYECTEYTDVGTPRDPNHYRVVSNKRGKNKKGRGRKDVVYDSPSRQYPWNPPYNNEEAYKGPNYFSGGYYPGRNYSGTGQYGKMEPGQYRNDYPSTSRSTNPYPNRGRIPLPGGNPISTQNRFAPLQYSGPRRGGDFHRIPMGAGRGAPSVPPNPGGGSYVAPPPAALDRKRKITEEGEEAGELKRVKPH